LCLYDRAAVTEVRIQLCGGFRVDVGRQSIPAGAWRQRKPAAVVKLLALAPRHRLHREQIMDALWLELPPGPAAANLRKAVHYARRRGGEELIVSVGELLSLPEGVVVDVDTFRALADRARRTADRDAYEQALDLHGDGLLPEDRYEDWAIAPREELRLEYVLLAEELAGLLESRGDVAGAIRAVGRQVAAEPLVEEPHLRLMRLYALAGRRGEALREYEHLCDLLSRELGREPGPEVQRLYEEVRARQTTEPERPRSCGSGSANFELLQGMSPGR
jgi:DNA-binding SARP family transcriptional activator